ncbi:MAG: hypothetical protein AB8G77_01475 [Rhodothermales bacterium]
MSYNQPKSYFLLLLLFVITGFAQAQTIPVDLQQGDRVVFVGDGLFENELDYGHFEYALTTAWPDRHITFRNIGWSGDTPAGTSRDHFTNPPTAHDHLIEQIKATKPTVAFVGYGAHMAFEDRSVLEDFKTDLIALLDSLEVMEVEVVLLSPAPQEPETSPAPSVNEHNQMLLAVSKQIGAIAKDRSYPFIDLMESLLPSANDPQVHISDNGLQLNDRGYAIAAGVLAKHLKYDDPEKGFLEKDLAIDVKKGKVSSEISDFTLEDKAIAFTFTPEAMPAPVTSDATVDFETPRLRVAGLRRGNHSLWMGNKKMATASAKDWARGVSFSSPLGAQATQLQELIYKKNRTYFYQYRPQNETYLVGFREYEQGNNARELQLLEPIIGEMENRIGRLRIPRDVSLKLVAD